ncbi:hypothetical protein METBIDRAFT_214055 [Metschnikowia bicuspidata var. bicuspidata NRRL YB-4993]|uniref:Protein KRE1 n=1 Tax=Metschnikowia bicuspidata var. bicuspidata NRRL YB-4993 TaxID=869754 RepID=A0A1A0H657_9ASCO|nr:hypothetical protein METBIDRAFT_214055 [Metschnikowia bicuspidata var. bicuspidata NRRL YB-4993]OBA19440.1 hypothetical protein METBIDRAFT_214055 [Metschnikowia bicuspidata var. bicuspidata NRRL YB-4993]
MHFLHIFTLIFASLVAATSSSSSSYTTSTTAATTTLVWVTGTNSNGVTVTTQSAYTQQFTSFYTSVALPSSGSIGIGTESGTVGVIRTYSYTTINGADGMVAGRPTGIFITSIAPLLSAIFGLFML